MGYPMTWRRVVHRNGLADGDYGTTPERHLKRVITNGTDATMTSEAETTAHRAPHWAKRVDEYEQAIRMLAGDIRRLEKDTVDENYVCQEIARRTGLAADDVAAVLKEWMGV